MLWWYLVWNEILKSSTVNSTWWGSITNLVLILSTGWCLKVTRIFLLLKHWTIVRVIAYKLTTMILSNSKGSISLLLLIGLELLLRSSVTLILSLKWRLPSLAKVRNATQTWRRRCELLLKGDWLARLFLVHLDSKIPLVQSWWRLDNLILSLGWDGIETC